MYMSKKDIQEVNLDDMEQVSGGHLHGRRKEFRYCSKCGTKIEIELAHSKMLDFIECPTCGRMPFYNKLGHSSGNTWLTEEYVKNYHREWLTKEQAPVIV